MRNYIKRERAGFRTDDGFEVVGSDKAGWRFREGVKSSNYMGTFLTREDYKAIDACAKRRGIKGRRGGRSWTELGGIRFY